jgi:RNA polymerase sigma-70 factor, ECF subfamily
VRAYDALIRLHDTPVARCNRAVALAMRGDVETARAEIAALAREPPMTHNRYYHVACAEINARTGDIDGARQSYARAMQYAGERDRHVIARRLQHLPES